MAIQMPWTLEVNNTVISACLFSYSGNNEVWENRNESTLTKINAMLEDMHKR